MSVNAIGQTAIPHSMNTPSQSKIRVGPILHFQGQDIVKRLWQVSMLLVLPGDDRPPSLPRVTLSHQPDRAVEGKIVAVAEKHFFVRYPFLIPQTNEPQTITYTIGSGRHTFHVPAQNDAARLALYSCNGYQDEAHKEELGGIQPLWKKLLAEHQRSPFSILVGLGDQLYNDGVIGKAEEPRYKDIRGVFALPSLQKWIAIEDPIKRDRHPFTQEMAEEAAEFYFEHYCRQYNEDQLKDALASIPSLMTWDDHDAPCDGFGSYPDRLQNSPVFRGLFEIALGYYLLFQQQVAPAEAKTSHLFGKDGYNFLFNFDGGESAILGVDTRSERSRDQVVAPASWNDIFSHLETLPTNCKHLIVMLGVPVVYPSLEILEKVLRTGDDNPLFGWILGQLPGFKNQFKLWELRDDGWDHWGHRAHIKERNEMIRRFQEFGKERNIRVTFISGDVHIGGAGKIFNPKQTDQAAGPEHIWQLITSAIGNKPPPSIVVSLLKGLSRDAQRIDDTRSMKLTSLQHDSDPGDQDSLFAARNYAIIKRDRAWNTLDVQLRVERDKDEEPNELCHIHKMTVPPNNPAWWQLRAYQLSNWWDQLIAPLRELFARV